ncbi:MAG: S8 family serine peptidase, partial [Actinomycetes bacterium]
RAKIAIVDSGIRAKHPDLNAKVAAQYDFGNRDRVAEDTVGHGTHVAGIAAASGGVGTCPGCSILAAKVTGDEGVTYDSAVAEGIVWSADNSADAINVSLVSPGYSRVLERAVEYAWNGGALVISAAGNEATETPMYPAAYGTAVAVAATDRDDAATDFSSRGDWVDVAAPGRQILSLIPGGGYAYLDGTSMASAYVSGLAGLLSSQGLPPRTSAIA